MDIPEGVAFREMAKFFGYGRILSIPVLKERYFSVRLWGFTLLVAWGLYNFKSYSWRYRFVWLDKHGVGHALFRHFHL